MYKSYFLTFSSFPPLLGALMCLFEMYAKSPLSLSLFECIFIPEDRVSTNPNTHPPLGPAFGKVTWMLSSFVCFLPVLQVWCQHTWKQHQGRASYCLTNHAMSLPGPQPGAHEHKLGGQEDLGLDPEGSWGMGSWASYLTSLDLSLYLYSMTHPAGMESAYESLEHWKSSVKTGFTPSHFRDIIAEGIRAYGASWQKQTRKLILSQNPTSRIMGTMCPCMSEQMS